MSLQKPVDPALPGAGPAAPGFAGSLLALAPGLLLVTAIGGTAYFLGTLHPSLDALALAILLGILTRALAGTRQYSATAGVRWANRVFIPTGIILYGTRLDFARLAALPPVVIIVTVLTMAAFYAIILALHRFWPLRAKTAGLVAAGSAICGASAIAVLSPVVEAEPEDTSIALLVITTVGLTGAMVYPLLRELTGMSDILYAVLSGATLHQTGIVRIAVSNMEPLFVSFALAVKTTRIVMLAGIAILTAILHQRGRQKKEISQAIGRVWFLAPFIAVGLAMSYLPGARSFFSLLSPAGTLIFSMALASIGLMVDIESVLEAGSRPLVIGFAGWILVVIILLFSAPLFI